MSEGQQEYTFDKAEFRSAISDLVPTYQQSMVLGLLEVSSSDIELIEKAGMKLLGESTTVGVVQLTGADERANRETPIWNAIQRQCYELFCTKSSAYKAERTEGVATIKHAAMGIATAIAGHYSLPIGVVTGPVLLALMTAMKLTRNAYCEAYKPISKG
ncbi:hypothetical protein [Burkholderia contaminans]|uniref:hypothetical protein n=1 Tax=Burkholderia contaminans TaxID=488447 RepID=UPI001583FE91|nr:hypothetical protein [Burkholderia contaminans]